MYECFYTQIDAYLLTYATLKCANVVDFFFSHAFSSILLFPLRVYVYAFTRLLARSIEIELNLKDCFNLVRYFCQLLLIRLILNVFFELVLYLGSYFVAFAKSLLFTALCSASFMLSFAVIRLMFFRPCFSLYSCFVCCSTRKMSPNGEKKTFYTVYSFFSFYPSHTFLRYNN